jgi:hypothetical protein
MMMVLNNGYLNGYLLYGRIRGNAGILLTAYGYCFFNGIEIPEQGQVQNCSFSFRTTIKTNSNENEAK